VAAILAAVIVTAADPGTAVAVVGTQHVTFTRMLDTEQANVTFEFKLESPVVTFTVAVAEEPG
jgi:hypothetical protein